MKTKLFVFITALFIIFGCNIKSYGQSIEFINTGWVLQNPQYEYMYNVFIFLNDGTVKHNKTNLFTQDFGRTDGTYSIENNILTLNIDNFSGTLYINAESSTKITLTNTENSSDYSVFAKMNSFDDQIMFNFYAKNYNNPYLVMPVVPDMTPMPSVPSYGTGSNSYTPHQSDVCLVCHGTGRCVACGGTGNYSLYGVTTKCAGCGGSGLCSHCHGTRKQ